MNIITRNLLVIILTLPVSSTFLALSNGKTLIDEANALQGLTLVLNLAKTPTIVGVGVINKDWATGLSSGWDELPKIIVKTRELIVVIKALLPLAIKTVTTIKETLEKLKAEDKKEKTEGNEGVNAIYALGYGISALEDLLPLLKEIASTNGIKNGLLISMDEWIRHIANFIGDFEAADPANNGKREQRDQLYQLADLLSSMASLLATKIVPQMEAELPKMKKSFETLFGKKV